MVMLDYMISVLKFSRKYDDLDDLFGRWNDDEFKKINDSITTQRQIDPELWK
jgi:hypothetical protein